MIQQGRNPKVSVCVITYNQEKYIRRCLQSIVDQEVDFDFEVIVGEDCSTDGTRAIVQEFVDIYPRLFHPMFHNENVGGCANYVAVHKAAAGEYIAHIDGDDYWNQNKLKTQVQYLDDESNCIAVFHRMALCNYDGVMEDGIWPKRSAYEKHDFTLVMLNLSDFVHSSMMYRRYSLDDFFVLKHSQFIDYKIYIHLASKGMVSCIDAVLGVYRTGVGFSITSSVRELMVQAVEYGYSFNRNTNSVDLALADKCLMLSRSAFAAKDIVAYQKLIRKSMRAKFMGLDQLMLYVLSYMPGVLNFLYFARKYWRDF